MTDRRALLIDTNMLTLWIVGQVSEQHISVCKRTRQYSVQDYKILCEYLEPFRRVIITPNIATETSNLLGVLNGKYLDKARAILASALQEWSEHYVKSSEVSLTFEYQKLGLTDAGIHNLVNDKTEVLTDDFDLYRMLLVKGAQVKNFNHLREL